MKRLQLLATSVTIGIAGLWLAQGQAVAQSYPPAVCQGNPPPKLSAPVKSPNAQPSLPFPSAWQAALDKFSKSGDVPGAVVIVKSPRWGVRVGTTGYADLVSKTPISPDMQFRVGSVSKMFTAQAVLQLEQQGLVKLTDPVTKYLGSDPVIAGIPNISKVTVSELLQMNSGITNYLAAPSIGFSPQLTPDKQFTADQLMAVLSPTGSNQPLTPDFAPGDTYPNPYWLTVLNKQPPSPTPAPYPSWYYSNSNYILLGMIAEKVTGQPIDQVIKKYVIDRAGLTNTLFAVDGTALPQMHGYTKYGSIPYPTQVYDQWCDVTATNPSYAWSAGAVISTPWDLLKLSDTMFKSETLLNEGTKEKWYTFVSADIHVGWETMEYGVGALMQPQRSYGTARGHGGAYPGYKSLVYYFFDSDTTFILASNTWDQEWEVAMLDTIMPLVSSSVTTPHPAVATAAPQVNGLIPVSWQAGRVYGDAYQVFWGADAAAVDRATDPKNPGAGVSAMVVTATSANLTVKSGQTYSWKVNTVSSNPSQPLINGPLWSFTAK